MTAATRYAAPAPQESDDPRNRLLDAFDATIEALIENGFEAQLRARFSRHLPPLTPEPDLFADPIAPRSADERLGLQCLASDLGKIAKLKMSAISHAAAARVRERVQHVIDATKPHQGKATP